MRGWSVTTRITAVFAGLLAVSLALSAVSASVGFLVADGFAEYRTAARQSRKIGDQAIALAEIRRQIAAERLKDAGGMAPDDPSLPSASQALNRLAFSHRLTTAVFADDPAASDALAKIGEDLMRYQDALAARTRLRADRELLDPALRGDASRLIQADIRLEALANGPLTQVGDAAMKGYRALLARLVERKNAVGPKATALAETGPLAISIATLVWALLGGALAALIGRRIARDIIGMAERMKRLAEGDLDSPIEGAERTTELGQMARALQVFRANTLEARRLQAEKEETAAREVALRIARDRAEAEIRAMETAKARIEHASLHDPLTGLANRRHLQRLLQRSIEQRAGVALLQIDLDNFKEVNDGLSHRAGDHVLRAVASIIQGALKDGEHAARMGGDEFLVLTPYSGDLSRAADIAERLLAEIAQPLSYKGAACSVGASIGVAAAHAHALEMDELLAQADAALHQAKHQGGGRLQVFDSALQARLELNRRTEQELKSALRAGQFEPFYQPQICSRTLAVTGFEALARWRHPERGVLTPGHFLETADRLHMTPQLDRAILHRAVAEIGGLNVDQGLDLRVSVNFSDGLLRDPALPTELQGLGAAATMLCAEVLETVFTDDDDAALGWNIDAMKELGVEVELDDFGSGHASVIGLTKLKPKRLKIDRRLVGPAVHDAKARRLVSSIVEMGKTLEIGCIAEGVETWEHVEAMRSLGVDLLQGFAIARPTAMEDLPRFLAEWRERTAAPAAQAS